MFRVEMLWSEAMKCWHVRVISPHGDIVERASWGLFINAMKCLDRWDKVYNNA
jgi:hypothetical protein